MTPLLTHLKHAGLAAGLLLTATAAQAGGLTLTFTPDTQTIFAGGTGVFTGTIKNISPFTVFLNGDSFTALSPGLTADDTPFLTNAPASLAPGAVYDSGPAGLFDVSVAPGTPDGSYSGFFNILGGADPNAQIVEATQEFHVSAPVPEASSSVSLAALLVLGLCTGGVAYRRRKAALSA